MLPFSSGINSEGKIRRLGGGGIVGIVLGGGLVISSIATAGPSSLTFVGRALLVEPWVPGATLKLRHLSYKVLKHK